MLSSLRTTARASRICNPSISRLARRTYASVIDLNTLPKPGSQLHGFTLQRTQHVPELELSALHFTHDRTGADYLHVAREDKNNVFSIGFKTNPPDATGVPHILEHVTLCGSEKYPVRDPFFKMLPRSLQNFMNAFTSTDYTMYPFATTNAQDFRNLMGVYLDATLHPLLKQSDFVQEGWRIGPANPQATEPNGKDGLVFKGVVYNEMKGQMSDATYLYYIRFFEQMFPSLNNFGGDPQKMTKLTYEQLKQFHKEHYHPSNSKILTYGDQPVEGHLELLAEQLSNFDKAKIDGDLKQPIQLDGPQEVTMKGPVDPLTPPDAQYKTSLTWTAGNTNDVQEAFGLMIAFNLLLSGYGSPFYRTLIEPGLGTDFSPNTGYDPSAATGVFSIGLNGVKKENLSLVGETIKQTLQDAVKEGFKKEKVDGLLHQMELSLKHKTASFGMGILRQLQPKWFNGLDPFEALPWNIRVEKFKELYSEGGYLEELIGKYVLNDRHLTFTMEPDASYGSDVAAEESSRLYQKIEEAIEQYPTEEEAYKQLRARELELVEEQDRGKTENTDVLPTLHVSDIPRQQPKIEIRDSDVGSKHIKVQWRETPTNGLTYFRALSLFDDLPEDLRSLIPLFIDCLQRIGTLRHTTEELEDLIKLHTGGIGFSYYSSPSVYDIKKGQDGLRFGGYAFDRNIPKLYELMQEMLLETNFDSPDAAKMIQQLLQAGASGAVDGVAETGHQYALSYAQSGLSPVGAMKEQTGGISQVKLITSLAAAEHNEHAMHELIMKLKALQAIVVRNVQEGRLRMALTCGKDATAGNEEALLKFLERNDAAPLSMPSGIPTFGSAGLQLQNTEANRRAFFPLPFQVHYSALALPTAPYTSQSSAPFSVLAQLLTHKHLHHEIREKGGAYGGGALANGLSGVFGMYSYRDPNPENTLKVYDEAGRWAAEQQWTDRELEEAKLSVFQRIDAPESVNEEGMGRFLDGIDHEMEQRRREWLLDVKADDIRVAAEKVANETAGARVALLGPERDFTNGADGRWAVQDMGMAGKAMEEVAEVEEAAVGVAT
ncbi:hypothetical protein K431DRAFT_271045 [Polychaeton citri CBS 116435]|uniref:Presequence protease, mitochondrial n=1 Tax=Polychaeton citri CBS 116435 TaxID=1314669 RepID=A0A9P4Q918_9PEZI|nr:hypothetical protein K431DRAFT_271045 [Polychaeton citri CBS 116435]